MGVAELHLEILALECGTIANADELQLLGEAVRHALHHVGEKGAGQAVGALGLKGKDLEMQLGYSHPVLVEAPENITFEVPSQTEIVVSGPSKEQVGQVAANIRKWRKPEPYKGKGIRYEGEHVRRKAGKAGKD